ncbi:hypothetical protein Bbelb_073970 [Branchiostoma belcheri]|nr:hypothetical protein Bbelb_073970 [Branchiostoma belcheri]
MDNFQYRRPHRQLWSPLVLNTLVSLRKEGADPRDDRSSYSKGDKFVDSSRVMNHVESSGKISQHQCIDETRFNKSRFLSAHKLDGCSPIRNPLLLVLTSYPLPTLRLILIRRRHFIVSG